MALIPRTHSEKLGKIAMGVALSAVLFASRLSMPKKCRALPPAASMFDLAQDAFPQGGAKSGPCLRFRPYLSITPAKLRHRERFCCDARSTPISCCSSNRAT